MQREDVLYYENEADRNLPKVLKYRAPVTYEGDIWRLPRRPNITFTQYYAGFQSTEIGGAELMPRLWRPAWNPNS